MLEISFFKHATIKQSTLKSLDEILSRIKNGAYKHEIANCRQCINAGDKENYNKYKNNLAAVTFSASFGRERRVSEIIEYSALVVIDIDHLSNELMAKAKSALYNDSFVHSVFVSPSGQGLKVLFKTDSLIENHKECFDSILNYVEESYSLKVDKSGSDITRLCYMSYDPELYFNIDSKIWNYIPTKNYTVEKTEYTPLSKKLLHATDSTSFGKQTEGKNDTHNRKEIKNIIRFLKAKNVSITSNYYSWVKVAFAIASVFTTEIGVEYFMEICRQDGANHSEHKSQGLIDYCYRNVIPDTVGFATIVYLAKEKGYQPILNKNK